MRCQAGVAPLLSRIQSGACPRPKPPVPLFFPIRTILVLSQVRGAPMMEQSPGDQRPHTSGSTGRSNTRVYPPRVCPPRVCPVAFPSSISRYSTARPPLPTEHSAPCEGKVETPAPLRGHRRHREGLTEPRCGVTGRPLPLSRQRNREAPSSELHTPLPARSPEPALPPGNGDPPGHTHRPRDVPIAAIRDAAAEPGGTRGPARRRDTRATGTPERHRRAPGSRRSPR